MIDQAFLEQIIEEWRKGNNKISVHFDQNFRTWKNKTKRGLSFLLSANLAKISPQQLWPRNEFIGHYLQNHTICYPLVFFIVKTNVDNQVLTTFVIENESTEKILEALNAIKSWNPSMNLRYGIADFYDEEIDVLESFFSGKF